MNRLVVCAALSLAASLALGADSEAKPRRRGSEEALILNVRPRSYLDAGNVVPAGSLDRVTGWYAQTRSYLNLPPWQNQRDRFGEGVLPDPITGPFVGARNPFGPVDFQAPAGLR